MLSFIDVEDDVFISTKNGINVDKLGIFYKCVMS